MTRLSPARPSTPCAEYLNVLPATRMRSIQALSWLGNREIVHGGAEHDDFCGLKFLQRALTRGDIGLQGGLRRRALAGGEVRAGEMRQRRMREIAIADLKARIGLAQPFDDGGGNLAADGVGAENAGVDVQKFHG